MRRFLAPAGQQEMMRKSSMHRYFRIFVLRRSCMKLYSLEKETP